jgi:hypothetical protein
MLGEALSHGGVSLAGLREAFGGVGSDGFQHPEAGLLIGLLLRKQQRVAA